MQKFNDEQYRAVRHRDGPMLVLAGPGSGKTAVIVGRVKHLILDEGIDPHNILVLTFSRAAAESMSSRFLRSADKPYPVTFGTFHAIFYHILKSQGLYRSSKILTNKEKIEILKRVSIKMGLSYHCDTAGLFRILECISIRKMGNEKLLNALDEDERSRLDHVFEPYINLCRNENLIDFDDMVNECLKALSGNDKIAGKWSERYRYILVDEFQDIDTRQYEVLRLLSGREQNVFCVGDDDQSIYSFRGSDPGLMKRFKEEYHNVSIVRLKINYRCPQKIIDHAQILISKNRLRFEKKQVCFNADAKDCVVYRCFRTSDEEAACCVEIIKSLLQDEGQRDGTIGVLYRISHSADMTEELLKHSLIPYKRKDIGHTFYDKEWVGDIISYLRLTLQYSEDIIIRILNRPFRGLTRECITEKIDSIEDMPGLLKKLFDDIDFIKGLDCYAAVNYILKGIGLYKYIKDSYFEGRREEMDEAVKELFDRARSYGSVCEWLSAIDECSDRAGLADQSNGGNETAKVSLMTIHGSKGLEFDNVIMIGLQEGVFPGKQCESMEAIEEERRLFYVAMTRCRKHLWLLGRRKDEYGKGESRFLGEAGFDSGILDGQNL